MLQSSIFNKAAGCRPESPKGLQRRHFPMQLFSTKTYKLFKNTYFQEHLYLHVTLLTMHEKDTANDT